MINRFHIRRAALALQSGGVIAYPTEGVWGLGCDPLDPLAVDRVLALKQRDPKKGLILVAASIGQFEPLLDGLSAQEREKLEAGWPGPLTWLVPHSGLIPAWISGGNSSVALRVSAHPTIIALCAAFGGPIVSTSANPSGRPAAINALQVRHYFCERLDYVLPGQRGDQRGPTAIKDLRSDRLLRQG
ncbi:MAG: yrdC [Verrucomicrobiaceae bacterium]|nr:yrdC [Verrucomicrobiaceae bacterium]